MPSEARSDEPVISVRGVGKRYEVFHSPTQRIRQAVTGHKHSRDIWALKDVNFEVRRGESVGIIGRNGSGKSTLMQIIAGTLAPTTGEVRIRGRIAALLELGSGFNPHFTGRENVILTGSIMGLSRKKMEAKLPEIEEFAEIGDFIDEPVSIYSSGMHARLAFAASVSLEPDILILDEILSVGDAGFQQRCIGRLHQLLSTGVTLLFVSHAADAVKSICRQGLLLVKGEQTFFGSAREAVDLYFGTLRSQQSARSVQRYEELAAAADERAKTLEAEARAAASPTDAAMVLASAEPEEPLEEVDQAAWEDEQADAPNPPQLRYGTGHARIESVRTLNASGEPADGFAFGDAVTVEVCFRASVLLPRADVIIRVRDKSGVDLFGVSVNEELPKLKLLNVQPGAIVRVRFEFINRLRAGPHGVSVSLIRPPHRRIGGGEGLVTLDHIDAAAAFQSLPRPGKVVRGKFQHDCRVEWRVLEAGLPTEPAKAHPAAAPGS